MTTSCFGYTAAGSMVSAKHEGADIGIIVIEPVGGSGEAAPSDGRLFC
jgi:hypothetical protein